MSNFDTIIIGAGVGGLSAANYQAKKGKRVLVIEQQDTLGGKAAAHKIGELITDPGPSIITMKWVYEQAFADWKESLDTYISFIPLPSIMSVRFENQEWTFPAGREAFLAYIRSHFSEDYDGFVWLLAICEPIYKKLKDTYYAHTFTSIFDIFKLPFTPDPRSLELLIPFKTLVESHFVSPVIRAFLYDFLTYSGHSYYQSSPSSLLILYTLIVEGAWYTKGGVHKIPEALANIGSNLGVNYHVNETVKSIQPEGDHYTLTTDKQMYTTQAVIANIDPIITSQLLGENTKSAKKSFSYITLTYSYSGNSNYLHHTLCLPRDFVSSYKNLFEHNDSQSKRDFVYYINHPRITDLATDPYLFVVAPVSTNHTKDSWPELLDNLDTQVRNDSAIRFPELSLTLIDSQSPRLFSERDSNPDGSLFGSGYSWFGLLPQSPLLKNHPKIIHVGGAVQPGAGLPMVMLSGKLSSQILQSVIA